MRKVSQRPRCVGEQSVVFIEEAEGAAIGVLDAPEQLEALMERLNQNGLRERVLYQNLAKRKDTILNTLGYHLVNLDLGHAPRQAWLFIFPSKSKIVLSIYAFFLSPS